MPMLEVNSSCQTKAVSLARGVFSSRSRTFLQVQIKHDASSESGDPHVWRSGTLPPQR